jgi:hypothetical protein
MISPRVRPLENASFSIAILVAGSTQIFNGTFLGPAGRPAPGLSPPHELLGMGGAPGLKVRCLFPRAQRNQCERLASAQEDLLAHFLERFLVVPDQGEPELYFDGVHQTAPPGSGRIPTPGFGSWTGGRPDGRALLRARAIRFFARLRRLVRSQFFRRHLRQRVWVSSGFSPHWMHRPSAKRRARYLCCRDICSSSAADTPGNDLRTVVGSGLRFVEVVIQKGLNGNPLLR